MQLNEENYHGYNRNLQPFANSLRKNMTKAEACLWKYVLKAGKMKGYQFRRQRPVLNYIADFMCIPLNLIIEVDGFSHQHAETASNDEIRDVVLKEAGFAVIRFSDAEVLNDINNVIRAIEVEIERIEGPNSGI